MKTTSLARAMGLLLPLAPIACSGPENVEGDEKVEQQSSAIQGGAADTVRTHNFAVGIATRQGAVCSGTLIAPNLVLTARHCVVPVQGETAVTCDDEFPTKNISPSSLFVSTEPSLRGAKKFYVAKTITTPTETGFCGNDIALVQLAKNIPSSEAQPATPVVQFSMTDATKVGGQITAMGYGITSPSARDSGTRRLREKIDIECVPGDKRYACKNPYKRMVESVKEFVTAGYVCSGDSGGGAFDQASFIDGHPFVLGALSRGPQTEEKCLAAIYSRTDMHADLILAAGEKASEEGGYSRPAWLDPPAPEPAAPPAPASASGGPCEGDACNPADDVKPVAPMASKASSTSDGCSMAAPRASKSAVGLLGLVGLVAVRRRGRRSYS